MRSMPRSHLGVRVDRSTKARDVKTARRIRDKWKRQIERGEFAVSGEATFASAARDYMKAGGDPRPIGPLLDFFLERPLSQIDQKAIDAAAIALYPGDDISPATRNREVYTPISAVLKHAGLDFKFVDQRARVAASLSSGCGLSKRSGYSPLLPHSTRN
jgi:hypothetical protein